MVDVNDIVEDVALSINREPASIKERHKKLNGLSEEDKHRIVNHRKLHGDDSKTFFVMFDKPPGKKILTITDMHPSVYYSKKTDQFNLKGNPDAGKNLEEWYENQPYDDPDNSEGSKPQTHYLKTVSKPLEQRLDQLKAVGVKDAYSSLQPEDKEVYLVKRLLDPNCDLKEGTPMKQHVTACEPFGTMYQNAPESEKKPVPKLDKEKNIVLTPNTKEEQETHNQFMTDLLERLSKAHNIPVDEVLRFVMSISCDTLSFEKVHHALLKATEDTQSLPRKAPITSKKPAKHTKTDSIR